MVMEIIVSVILLFVGVAISVIVHMLIIARVFRRELGDRGIRTQGSNNNNVNNSNTCSSSSGLSARELEKLPWFDHKAGGDGRVKGNSLTGDDGNNNNNGVTAAASPKVDCAICLDEFKEGDRCRLLPNCSHSFHLECVDSWLMKKPFCPVCRTLAKLPSVIKPPPVSPVAASSGGGRSGNNRRELFSVPLGYDWV